MNTPALSRLLPVVLCGGTSCLYLRGADGRYLLKTPGDTREDEQTARLIADTLNAQRPAAPSPAPYSGTLERGPDQSYNGPAIRIDLAGWGGAFWLGWEGGTMAESPERYAEHLIACANATAGPATPAALPPDASRSTVAYFAALWNLWRRLETEAETRPELAALVNSAEMLEARRLTLGADLAEAAAGLAPERAPLCVLDLLGRALEYVEREAADLSECAAERSKGSPAHALRDNARTLAHSIRDALHAATLAKGEELAPAERETVNGELLASLKAAVGGVGHLARVANVTPATVAGWEQWERDARAVIARAEAAASAALPRWFRCVVSAVEDRNDRVRASGTIYARATSAKQAAAMAEEHAAESWDVPGYDWEDLRADCEGAVPLTVEEEQRERNTLNRPESVFTAEGPTD